MSLTLTRHDAEEVIESLRNGIPPRRFASAYAAGTSFVQNVRRRHLQGGIGHGKIRFVSGQWGSGKTHLFRLLREEAFDANMLVSTVELTNEQTPFNKFERVFYEIVRNITSPNMYRTGDLNAVLPFGRVLDEVLRQRAGDVAITAEQVDRLTADLFAQTTVDIDFRKVVGEYWKTYLAEDVDPVEVEQRRAGLLQWFEGEAHLPTFRRAFDVQKTISKENARILLTSLGHFVRWLGFGGLVILFDESEMTHSTMRKSSLRQAHNNLLQLINEIDECEGIFLIYAAVPEFFDDPRTGITQYGALSGRIGMPHQRAPRALDTVWNIDLVENTTDTFQEAASRIGAIFQVAYPEDSIGDHDSALRSHIAEIVVAHPEFGRVSAWRIVIQAAVEYLDNAIEGEENLAAKIHHKSIMDRLADD
jgi:hypothetical protein